MFNILYSALSVLSLLFLSGSELNNYPTNIILFIVIFIFINKMHKYKKNTVLLSLVLTFFLLLGKYKIYLDDSSGLMLAIKLIITPIGTYILFQHLFGYVFDILDNKKKIKNITPISYKLSFIIAFLVICFSWLAVLIIKYPGIIYPDTLNQIIQSFGDRPLNNMNPLFHTLLIKTFYDISLSFTNNINVATFIVSLVQLVFCTCIYAYVCKYIYKRTNMFSIILASQKMRCIPILPHYLYV